MNWKREVIVELASSKTWNYQRGGPSFTEPAALAALALISAGHTDQAQAVAAWFAKLQQSDGAVGVSEQESTPKWPTAMALSVWSRWQGASGNRCFQGNIKRAIQWATSHEGVTLPKSPIYGHDTTLLGWPWAMGTHAWLEPTCMFVVAMALCGLGKHRRTAEGLRIIKDRQLPSGGFNYGNTFVLGQKLKAHPQPTGMALATLAMVVQTEKDQVLKSIDFLKSEWPHLRGTSSFCYSALGLAAYDELPADFEDRLKAIWTKWKKAKASQSTRAGIYPVALIALALQGPQKELFSAKASAT